MQGYEWHLQLVIPEPEPEVQADVKPSAGTSVPPRRTTTRGIAEHVDQIMRQLVPRENDTMASASSTPITQDQHYEDSGIFPYVSLSPPSARLPSGARPLTLSAQTQTRADPKPTSKKSTSAMTVHTTPTKPTWGRKAVNGTKRERVESSLSYELDDDDNSMVAMHQPDKGKSASRDSMSQSASVTMRDSTSASRTSVADTASRSRSLTGTSSSTAIPGTSRTRVSQPRTRSPTLRYPTPPPADAPLGPAARSPILPAYPSHLGDGGGPAIDDSIAAVPSHITGATITYSCRPGPGPYLFDLLGTLPLAEYGVLSWEVIDREDEIWESDDVKEEYKVMHALWARWVFVQANR